MTFFHKKIKIARRKKKTRKIAGEKEKKFYGKKERVLREKLREDFRK
jgi:hypothetical protein